MITDDERINAISASIDTGEKKILNYRNDFTPRPVKSIPLEYLLYNPHNGRIRSYTKSFENQFHPLDSKNSDDKKIIEQYLYDSAIGRNEKTLESLSLNGQQEVGIVTKDGVIIDGNRRAMLLNILSRRNKRPGYFNAVVLPDKLLENQREIVTLETSFQMGVDSKVDYNPIEKYLRCYELNNDHKLSIENIATIMAEEKSQIEEWLSILKIMDEYLIYLGTPGVYTRLEKREGHFVDLRVYLKTYQKRPSSIKWNYTEEDLDNLKKAYFTYIRLGIPVQRARVIAKPTANSSFFCNHEIWDDFLKENQITLSSYKEPSYTEMKISDPQKSDEDIIRNIDTLWRNNIGELLLNDLSYSESVLKDKIELLAPVKILKKVVNSLGQIDYEALKISNKREVESLLNTIEFKIIDFRNFISLEKYIT